MQTNSVTAGEVNLYKKIRGFQVRAILGNSSAGYGWRTVCGGVYLGSECLSSERAAITQGKILADKLKNRVESADAVIKKIEPCGACGDGCEGRQSCRLVDESPPTLAIPKKRDSRRKGVSK